MKLVQHLGDRARRWHGAFFAQICCRRRRERLHGTECAAGAQVPAAPILLFGEVQSAEIGNALSPAEARSQDSSTTLANASRPDSRPNAEQTADRRVVGRHALPHQLVRIRCAGLQAASKFAAARASGAILC
jgi:hypothetical protein